jgi:hypothetical protein
LSLAIGVGLLLGLVIESAGLTYRLGRLAAPLLRLAHLREASALAFATAFLSPAAASATLMNAFQEGAITRRELMLSGLLLTFPGFFAHLPTMFFTIAPILGALGVGYLALLLAADVLRTLAFLLYGRLALPPYEPPAAVIPSQRPDWRQVWAETLKKFRRRLKSILAITIPVYVVVFLAQEMGLFEALRRVMAQRLQGANIPLEALSILMFSLAAEATGGYAAAGAIMEGGALSSGAVLLTLLLGTIIASPMRAVRHQLPYYLGVYTPAMGLRLMVMAQVFRTLSLIPFVLAVYFWWR